MIKKILQLNFLQNKQTDFTGLFIFIFAFIFIHVAMAVSLTIKNPKFTLLSCILHFDNQKIKGFREKGEWNTGIKNCVQPP